VVRNIINKRDSHCKIMESSILNSVYSDSRRLPLKLRQRTLLRYRGLEEPYCHAHTKDLVKSLDNLGHPINTVTVEP
jgi:hypothetical protein